MIVATMFDGCYVDKAIACLKSAEEHGATPMAVCLDDAATEAIGDMFFVHTLHDIEERFPALLTVKNSRQWSGYLLTLRPFIIEFIAEKYGLSAIVDADVKFYAAASLLADEIGDCSFMVARTGLSNLPFNEGVIVARHDKHSLAFLRWWQSQMPELVSMG